MIYDQDIREPLFDFLERQYARCRILEEMNIGKSRADVVMVCEDGIIGLEIKSDADSYTRLSGQVKDYDRYFDQNYVVVGTKHALHIREHVPDWWGIITVELTEQIKDGKTIRVLDFYILRHPQNNPLATWKKKLELLWKPELAQIQEAFQMPKYKEKRRTFAAGKIAERTAEGKIDPSRLQEFYCELLFERDYTMAEEILSEYRKGEIQKALEHEDDPARQMELMMEQQVRKQQLRQRQHRNKRRVYRSLLRKKNF